MMLVASGLSLVISGTNPIYFKEHPDFQILMNFSIVPGARVPLGVLIFLILIVIAAVILSRTIVGRYAFSIGSNETATALSGVNVVAGRSSSTRWPACSSESPASSRHRDSVPRSRSVEWAWSWRRSPRS